MAAQKGTQIRYGMSRDRRARSAMLNTTADDGRTRLQGIENAIEFLRPDRRRRQPST